MLENEPVSVFSFFFFFFFFFFPPPFLARIHDFMEICSLNCRPETNINVKPKLTTRSAMISIV